MMTRVRRSAGLLDMDRVLGSTRRDARVPVVATLHALHKARARQPTVHDRDCIFVAARELRELGRAHVADAAMVGAILHQDRKHAVVEGRQTVREHGGVQGGKRRLTGRRGRAMIFTHKTSPCGPIVIFPGTHDRAVGIYAIVDRIRECVKPPKTRAKMVYKPLDK